jgi:rRNA maturation endonuclease Nob1
MKRCIVCRKELEENEDKLCEICNEFFNRKYTDEEIDEILEELERLDNEA